jgi:ribosome-binding factor A
MDVEVTTDLSYATVFVAMGEAEDPEDVLEGLKAAAGFMRRRLGELIQLRHIPELRFRQDETLEKGFRMDSLLRQLAEERGDD